MANPNVGMMYPVWSPLTAHTDGSMPTYGTGKVIQEARNATVSREYANNPLYGDDHIVDDDNGLTGLMFYQSSNGDFTGSGSLDFYDNLVLTKQGGSTPSVPQSNSTESFSRSEEVAAGWQ